jgi:hypothetical protein
MPFASPPISRAAWRPFAVLLLAMLAACGGRGNDTAGAPTGPAAAEALAEGTGTAPPAPTLKERIDSLERSGVVPPLDRSSDIAGPDANQNGVRDDIEAWINAQPVNEGQRKALMQDARATQHTLLVDLSDQSALQHAGERLTASMKCGLIQFSPYETFSKLAGKIESMTANTRERAKRYMQYNAARSGSSTTSPTGNTCEP